MIAMETALHTRSTERIMRAQALPDVGASAVLRMPPTSPYKELAPRDSAAEDLMHRNDLLLSFVKQAFSIHFNLNLCLHLSWFEDTIRDLTQTAFF